MKVRMQKCADCMKVRMQKCKMTCFFVIKMYDAGIENCSGYDTISLFSQL